MTVLRIEVEDRTEDGWPVRVAFRGVTRSGLLHQRPGLPYRLPDGTVQVPNPGWWLRTAQPESDEWLGDADNRFLNNVETLVRRLWGSEIDEWSPQVQPKPAAARLLPKMPLPAHTRRKP